ncbi:hypothetical protein LEP1GSC170_0717 [Leptospira interrogans serovar Bataviae str. HAI135]|nr:hypothetical protein LEP1GSC170_0717 [Leptospira interrogans serovar Bataviae str. HAI135]
MPNQMQLSPKLKVLFFDENEYNSSKQNLFPGYNNDKIEILFSFKLNRIYIVNFIYIY